MTKIITIIKKYFFLIIIISVYILTEFSLISLTAWNQNTPSFLWNIPIFLTYIVGYGVIGACFPISRTKKNRYLASQKIFILSTGFTYFSNRKYSLGFMVTLSRD